MNLLVTGGSGFLGAVLIQKLLAQGHKVYSVSRSAPDPMENLVALRGDILQPGLGLQRGTLSEGFAACYHLAAVLSLGSDRDGMVWQTNVDGTRNVLEFCARYRVPHLYFCSTAYTNNRNPYERSKRVAELMVLNSDIPQLTIFKPSIIVGTGDHYFAGHFAQFVTLMVKIHKRAELVRRKIEGTLRLPVIQPVFRVRGDPEARLNLVPVDAVAEAMASTTATGTYWLTHPSPPSLKELGEWVGDFIMVELKFERDFRPMPLEMAFSRLARPFLPYLWGDDFPSHLRAAPFIDRAFMEMTLKRALGEKSRQDDGLKPKALG